VLGVGRGAVHLDLDGFVVTLSGRRVPLMPNAIAVGADRPPAAVGWDPAAPPVWDPVVPPLADGPERVAGLAAWLASRVAVPEVPAGRAAARLLGRGPGLTPEGDDVLCGAAVAIRALGPAAGAPPERIATLMGLLCPADAAARTGALSATLLRLAAGGAAPEPAHRLIGARDREAALADLARLGSSTGRALASGIALGARYLIEVTSPG
jgi:hypothetical protein